MFSDGTSSQFKNQYIFHLLIYFRTKLNLKNLNWHIYATSHGKGAVDGIGGAVKRTVWPQTLNRDKEVVHSLNIFCDVAKERCQKVEIVKVTLDEITEEAKEFDTIIQNSKSIKDIKNM